MGALIKIGPYFISKTKIIAQPEEYRQGRNTNGLYDSELDHWKMFDQYHYESVFNTDDYINVPRGRVLFDENRQRSIIYIDQCFISNQKILAQIIELFQIEQYTVKLDLHYRCPNCLGDIWE